MKKVIIGLFLIIVMAIAGSLYYLFTNLDALIESAIEEYGSEATQTSVLVDSVKTDLPNGVASITGLTIGNPSGFDLDDAFSLAEIRVAIDLQSLQKEPYIINKITVLGPQVYAEINEDNKTNLNELKKNLAMGSTGNVQDANPQAPAGGSENEPRLIIRKITFAEGAIQVKVAALKNKEYALKLPSFEMNNLGGSRGATATEIASEILKRLTDRANDIVKKELIDAELNKLKDKAQNKIDGEKDKILDKAKSELEQEADKLKNLFGR